MTATSATATAQAAPAVTPAARPAKTEVRQRALPTPNSDFYQLVDVLTAEEKAIVKKVRTYMETKVQPVINKYWSDDEFPFELLPSFKELDLGGLGLRAMAAPAESRAFSRTPKHEGMYQMQNLIVGKAITGHGAFV